MEMKLIQKEASIWIEEEPTVMSRRLSAEAVIPDSREDARCLVWTQGGVLLKGKEPAANSCTFSGEVWASVLYLNESGKLETMRISKEFELSAEAEGMEADALPQISWHLSALEGRLLNPRKLGVSFEVRASISTFRRGTICLEPTLPEGAPEKIHLQRESRETLVLAELREKPFSVREKLTIGDEETVPRSIAGESVRFTEMSAERLGSRCIVKGELELRLWGLDERELPAFCSFRVPFSQLAELNDENEGLILVQAQPSSLYLEWLEGIGGERSLDAEIHGALQLRVYARQSLCFASDGYCSRMRSVPVQETGIVLRSLKRQKTILKGEERLPLPEDLQELLAAEPNLGPLEWDREQTQLPVSLDLLIRRADGTLDALHRSFRLRGNPPPENAKAQLPAITDFSAGTENGKLELQCSAELLWIQREEEQLKMLSGLELDADSAWDPASQPALSLVLNQGDSLWELAKEYHSSVEAILSCNPEQGEILLIPAE